MAPASLGVVIVTFNSSDVILECLESLRAARDVALTTVVVDNASTDDTLALLRDVEAGGGLGEGHRLEVIEAGVNGGFAAGVNLGLAHLAALPGIDRFWVLNPDSVVLPGTAHSFATHGPPADAFGLMGGRVLYFETPEIIQIDGGTINRRTGVTGNIGLGQRHGDTPPANPRDIDFITGASVVVSRTFYETAGPMPEDYFLYYEEVDWALLRGTLPLIYCPEAVILHKAGTAIGSPTLDRPASPFSQYFKHRARLRFVRRHLPWSLPTALAYSLAKAAQLRLKGYPAEARAVLDGSFGRPPAAEIRERLSPDAQALAFR